MPGGAPAALIEIDEARRLWRAVLRQMWIDAGGNDPDLRDAVRRWIDTAAFITCCDYAGAVPSKVARELRQRLAMPVGLPGYDSPAAKRDRWRAARAAAVAAGAARRGRGRPRKAAAQAEAVP